MTTVVASLECMAADERITSGGPICHAKKIHRIGESLFGFCGDLDLSYLFLDWLGGRRNRDHLYKLIPHENRNEFGILELSSEGLAHWTGWGVRVPLKDSTYAIGSGAMAALRAFRDGKPIEEAIRGAMELDEGTGLLIAVEVAYLLPPELVTQKGRRKR